MIQITLSTLFRQDFFSRRLFKIGGFGSSCINSTKMQNKVRLVICSLTKTWNESGVGLNLSSITWLNTTSYAIDGPVYFYSVAVPPPPFPQSGPSGSTLTFYHQVQHSGTLVVPSLLAKGMHVPILRVCLFSSSCLAPFPLSFRCFDEQNRSFEFGSVLG